MPLTVGIEVKAQILTEVKAVITNYNEINVNLRSYLSFPDMQLI